MFSRIEEAVEDLKQGKVIIVVDDEDRENEGDFVALAEKTTPETINFMIKYGRGLVCAPIAEETAISLHLTPMVEKIQITMKQPLRFPSIIKKPPLESLLLNVHRPFKL